MNSIIINRMYAGEYLTRGIGGGEVINLLHSDEGINYCFINPQGLFNSRYDNTVRAVIHTRLYETGCFEVIGVSILNDESQLVHAKGCRLKEKLEICSHELREYTKKHPINYGGVPYIKDTEEWVPITFKSEKLLYPKRQIFILDSHYNKTVSDCIVSYKMADKRFAKQSLHMYVDDISTPDSFNEIMRMINEEEIWCEIITRIDNEKHNNHFNFLTLIGKEDDELSFSNMFNYFFSKYSYLFVDFAREILNININPTYSIKREFHNIDLWIEDDTNILIIENKIKSGINGVSYQHDFSDGCLIQSQLSKYYSLAENYAREKHKRASYFLFLPNHNKLDLSLYEGSKLYKEIRYRDIYNYLVSKNVNDPYYLDFCNALYKHTKDIPIDYSEVLLNYLIKQINKNK